MTELQIPDEYKPGFNCLISIDSHTEEKLLEALRQSKPFLYLEDLALSIAENVNTLTVEELVSLIQVLISLYKVKNYFDGSINEVVERISQAIQNDDELTNVYDKKQQEFKQRLITFLEFDGVLSIASKAIELMHDYERIFKTSRVLTDMRPIFESDLEKEPACMATVHMLKIEYEDLDGTHEFFVALDSADVKQLRKQLDRAEKKTKSIELMLNQANIPYLNYPSVE
ncbi:MAG: hypothetical protein QNJ36_08395 [Calothrix sp. MO_167.B42]|nr:hypothetical protein [Calothrix sp. MO_167.B42]